MNGKFNLEKFKDLLDANLLQRVFTDINRIEASIVNYIVGTPFFNGVDFINAEDGQNSNQSNAPPTNLNSSSNVSQDNEFLKYYSYLVKEGVLVELNNLYQGNLGQGSSSNYGSERNNTTLVTQSKSGNKIPPINANQVGSSKRNTSNNRLIGKQDNFYPKQRIQIESASSKVMKDKAAKRESNSHLDISNNQSNSHMNSSNYNNHEQVTNSNPQASNILKPVSRKSIPKVAVKGKTLSNQGEQVINRNYSKGVLSTTKKSKKALNEINSNNKNTVLPSIPPVHKNSKTPIQNKRGSNEGPITRDITENESNNNHAYERHVIDDDRKSESLKSKVMNKIKRNIPEEKSEEKSNDENIFTSPMGDYIPSEFNEITSKGTAEFADPQLEKVEKPNQVDNKSIIIRSKLDEQLEKDIQNLLNNDDEIIEKGELGTYLRNENSNTISTLRNNDTKNMANEEKEKEKLESNQSNNNIIHERAEADLTDKYINIQGENLQDQQRNLQTEQSKQSMVPIEQNQEAKDSETAISNNVEKELINLEKNLISSVSEINLSFFTGDISNLSNLYQTFILAPELKEQVDCFAFKPNISDYQFKVNPKIIIIWRESQVSSEANKSSTSKSISVSNISNMDVRGLCLVSFREDTNNEHYSLVLEGLLLLDDDYYSDLLKNVVNFLSEILTFNEVLVELNYNLIDGKQQVNKKIKQHFDAMKFKW
eukprot:CAMPEP_0170525424 /NCGR_PEP_ID=MMETSP0209-20121228/10919_1 /TAXON_ID=665100 ORGANISM="Litonotus pictus, Strain P1" /NCGR_SAMPLE_ID=MMETSP0209 /ASSEMBLY_ACC=CAM_ASM_000301 /LENGTH=709 /DNA_ID=CAMNT_0010814693 /DNA_START=1222 /DNA_END=3348 /DNA_ORIENTATION=-